MLNRAGAAESESSPLLSVTVGTEAVPLGDIFELSVEQEPNVIDAATITMSNVSGVRSRSMQLKASVEVRCGDDIVFTGEVMGMEPTYDHDRPSRLVVRALNRMHRMTHNRLSRTYTDMTDDDIAAEVCKESKLTPPEKNPTTQKYGHIHRVSQTGLEFLRERASLIDYELNVIGERLQFRPRDKLRKVAKSAALGFRKGKGRLISFKPRLSLMNQVDEVVCYGWNAAKKEQIVGKAKALPSASIEGVGADLQDIAFGSDPVVLHVDWHGKTKEEADATAKRILQNRMMSYITGEAIADGMAGLKVGESVDIEVPDPRFTGSYYVVSLRYRYVHDPSGGGHPGRDDAGFRTYVKVQRDRSA